jgi:DNA-binding LacI/PurR family transcriptional regulator
MKRRRVTSLDVAKRAGVSRTTVSLVLNNIRRIQISEETRQKVLLAAEELGYVPNAAAQALARRRTQTIGLVLTRNPHHIAFDAFINQILEGLIHSVHHYELRLLFDIVEPEHQLEAYLQLAHAHSIDGLILSGPRSDDEALRTLEQVDFPVVLMGHLPGADFYSVDVDNRAAARMAVEHLLGLGYTRVACITNADLSYTAAEERLLGYRQALEAADLRYDSRLVRYGDFTTQSGYQQMSDLLGSASEIQAVFCASDTVALGAKAAIRERGIDIPEGIALVGFDDLPFTRYIEPPLTTVRLPAQEIARRASEILLKLLRGEPPPERHVILETELVVRSSCGAVLKGRSQS